MGNINEKMFTIVDSKPVSGYTVHDDSYLHRNEFGVVDILLHVTAITIQSTWHTIAFMSVNFFPTNTRALSAYIRHSETMEPISGYVFNDGSIKVYNPQITGQYDLWVYGSYFI